jgi:hypothetical protein
VPVTRVYYHYMRQDTFPPFTDYLPSVAILWLARLKLRGCEAARMAMGGDDWLLSHVTTVCATPFSCKRGLQPDRCTAIQRSAFLGREFADAAESLSRAPIWAAGGLLCLLLPFFLLQGLRGPRPQRRPQAPESAQAAVKRGSWWNPAALPPAHSTLFSLARSPNLSSQSSGTSQNRALQSVIFHPLFLITLDLQSPPFRFSSSPPSQALLPAERMDC